ncbi:MAG: ABC transporter substrate-binding protein, partial [Intestinibacter sp.]|uniref:ABC transporter substrate-binding protein n=1 Tax=Intestinibacter sp. TaxID=1965304 RepID=UPI003F182879
IFNTDRWKDNSNKASTTVATAIEKVEKIDDYTVKFTFNKVYYPYLTELSYPRPCRMMAESSLDENGEFKEPIGTGMWKVESYEEGKETVLVPNEYYWGEKPKIDKLIVKVIPDAEARMMALQNGEIDMDLTALSAENQEIVAGEDSLDTFSRDGVLGIHLLFNYDNEIIGKDKNVRQAINYAIDNDVICDTLLKGNGTPAKGLIPTTSPYVNEDNSLGYDYDIDKAKDLLKEAGYADSNNDGILEKDGKPLEFNFVLQTDEYPDWKAVSEYVQSQLKQVGIDVKLNVQDSTSYYDAIWTTRDYDISIYRTYADSWEPHGFLLGMFCKSSDDAVRVAWNSDKLDKMIDETLQTVDETERQKDYDEIFKYMYEEAVDAPLYYTKDKYAYNKDRITGVENAATSYELIKWNKIDVVE